MINALTRLSVHLVRQQVSAYQSIHRMAPQHALDRCPPFILTVSDSLGPSLGTTDVLKAASHFPATAPWCTIGGPEWARPSRAHKQT